MTDGPRIVAWCEECDCLRVIQPGAKRKPAGSAAWYCVKCGLLLRAVCTSYPLSGASGETSSGVDTLPSGSLNPVIDTRLDLLPLAHLAVGQTMKHGMKYEVDNPDNWKGVPTSEHLNHALRHVYLYMAGDNGEDHLAHAATRLMMAVELER